MSLGFPLYIDLNGNNCVVFGGGPFAASRALTLLRFGARVTVISPTLCDTLRRMDEQEQIRYIPRRYYRGDCTCAYLCVAATDDEALNIAISDECKAKGLPVNVSKPAAFGTFLFPSVAFGDNVVVSVSGSASAPYIASLREQIEEALPIMEDKATGAEKRAASTTEV
ncbi:MAG: NAD(P)-dependent oxidoreductase [Clostridiales bacterium]|nr:NAD(P)-dependent oxidoreductase [Clostridiales bacterium]